MTGSKYEFGILGPLAVRLGGQERDLAGPRIREVLAVLLVNANRPVTADELADELWHGEAGAPRSAVHVQIARLRRALGPAFGLSTTAAGYARRDDHDAALLATASELNDDRGIYESEKPVYDKVQASFLAPARERLGKAAWDRAGDEARSMTTEAVLALAEAVRSRYEEAPAVAGA